VGPRQLGRERSSVPAGAGGDVEELAGLAQGEFVPDPSRHHDGLSGAQFDLDVTVGVFETKVHGTGDEIKEFVSIGMDLAAMWRIAGDQRSSDREAIDAVRRPAGFLVDEDGLSGAVGDADDMGGQVDQLAGCDLVGAGHGSSMRRRWMCLVLCCPFRRSGFANQYGRFGQHRVMEASDANVIAASIVEPAAFGVIFDRHASTILRYFARRVEPAAAEGLLGELFRIAFEQRASFDPSRSSARPWLYGIAANLVGRHRRSEQRRLHAMARLVARQPTDQNDVVGEHSARSIDAAEAWSRLAGAVDALPVVERQALLLFAWENLSYDDIADALGVPVGTVRSRLNRARRRLREHDVSAHIQPSKSDLAEADTNDR